MPHKPPTVDDCDSDENETPQTISSSPEIASASTSLKRSPRPYGPGLGAHTGSDSGYSSHTTTTFGSTASNQQASETSPRLWANSQSDKRISESTVRTPKRSPQAAHQPRDGSLPTPPSPSPLLKMSRRHRSSKTARECNDPNCECWVPSRSGYEQSPTVAHDRRLPSMSYRVAPPAEFPSTTPRPRPPGPSRPRPSSYYAGMPMDGYGVPAFLPAAYGLVSAGPTPPPPYPWGPSYHAYGPTSAPVVDALYSTPGPPVMYAAPNPKPDRTRPNLRSIKTDTQLSRPRSTSVYGTPLVLHDPSPYDGTPYPRSAAAYSRRDYNGSYSYVDDRNAMPPPPQRPSRNPSDDLVLSRHPSVRQSRSTKQSRSRAHDPRREDYDDFDPNMELPSSRTPSRRRPSRTSSYSPEEAGAGALRTIESRSGRRTSYASQASAKLEEQTRSAEAYVEAVSGRAAVKAKEPSATKDPLDVTPLLLSQPESQSRSRRPSASRSQAGSSQEGTKGRLQFTFHSKESFTISGDTEGRIIDVVPKEDGTAEILVSNSTRETRYPLRSHRSSSDRSYPARSSIEEEDAAARIDGSRVYSRGSRRSGNETP